ncbi:hypothetical protein N7474_005054 [Penicillium riverlandense]|uniref:uncharacterized protein n=1 Tax=Penicillium riverlandense TaxID=1903569 RepID=UPI002548010F|nr:uncharacterized protein N7474_005054 [Penicillium riverlandense]KAJ5819463.1 hypothetical protein N7474_005054 [Penicillium riverlandense]
MRRHNGLLSSCEPCRRGKLRCDHSVPTCGRCRRKDKAAACVYKLSPTRARQSKADIAAATPPNPATMSPTPQVTVHASPGPRSLAGPQYAVRDRYIENWNHRLALNSTPSFLGPTSFSAVYSENEASLKQHSSVTPLRLPEIRLPDVADAIDDHQAQLGADLLSLLFDDFGLYRRTAIACDEQISEGILGLPTVRTLCDLVEGMYNSVPDHLDPQSRLLALSRRLFEGTARELVTHATMTLDEYLVALAGRWEVIGFILTMSGVFAAHATLDDPTFHGLSLTANDHKNLGILATAGGDQCLQFCDSLGVMSDTLGWLLIRHIHLLTLVCGDYELSTLLFAIGYHQLDAGEHLPFFLAEGRKRLMASAYALDKELATFLGCPPLIAYRFCRMQLPLDLEPAEVIAEPAVRGAAIHRLDANGWNTKALINGTSWCRMAVLRGHVRELVLELSLDSGDFDIRQRVDEVSSLAQQVRNEIPSYLQWDGNTETTMRLTNTFAVYLHLDLLYSDFLLQRILVKRSVGESETLISLANQMLKAVLAQISISQRCGRPYSLGWTIPYFGLPSAGILAIELLRRTQNPHPRPNKKPFPRSEVIQNLSILASHIQYIILPQKGNYEVCQQGRKAILYILDHVLSTHADATAPVSTVPSDLIPTDWLNDEWLNDGTEFIRWIDTLNWDV